MNREDKNAVTKEEGVNPNRLEEKPWYNLVNSGGVVVDVYPKKEYAIMACDYHHGSYVREIHPTLETSTIIYRCKVTKPFVPMNPALRPMKGL
jgi:hypothetical protein